MCCYAYEFHKSNVWWPDQPGGLADSPLQTDRYRFVYSRWTAANNSECKACVNREVQNSYDCWYTIFNLQNKPLEEVKKLLSQRLKVLCALYPKQDRIFIHSGIQNLKGLLTTVFLRNWKKFSTRKSCYIFLRSSPSWFVSWVKLG